MPDLRARETSLRHQAQALDAQLADREVYLKLADNLGGFLATLRKSAVTDAEALREEIAGVLVPLGLRLSPAKTRIVHMSDGARRRT